jgi:(p)ppGpp synthase/HD superfamily hydrolase
MAAARKTEPKQYVVEGNRSLSDRFDQALQRACELHRSQFRKGTEIPYLSHLLAVASLVLEDGGDEDQAIAALLHDAVEDQGGRPTLDSIRSDFGDRVASIVEACSDTDTYPKPAWRERKENYLRHLREEPRAEVLRVSAADKLHNARCIIADYRRFGESVWRRFNAGKEEQAWYYGQLARIYREHGVSDFLSSQITEAAQQIVRFSLESDT